MNQLINSRNSRALDAKSQKQSRKILPQIKNTKVQLPQLKIRSRIHGSSKDIETHVRRYDEKQEFTILSIRFASSQSNAKKIQEELYIKHTQKSLSKNNQQQNQQKRLLPYMKYRRQQSPEEHLRSLGYNPDIRLSSEIYSDKVQQKKLKYLNKMDSLKRDLNNYSNQGNRVDNSRIRIKILGEEIRRKRQRQNILFQQRRGRQLLNSMLNSSSQVVSA